MGKAWRVERGREYGKKRDEWVGGGSALNFVGEVRDVGGIYLLLSLLVVVNRIISLTLFDLIHYW